MALYMTISTAETRNNPHHVVKLGLSRSALNKMGKKALLGGKAACLAEYAAHPNSSFARKVLINAHLFGSQLERRFGIEDTTEYPVSLGKLLGLSFDI